jgi:hypothetical protein
MTNEKVYSLFRESDSGPEYLTDISAKSMFEAKLKARMQFKGVKMFIVANTAIKRVNGRCKV